VAKPIVDGLERDLAGQAKVVRLDLMSSVGQQAAGQFGIRGVPTLVVVDGQGQVVLTQVGLLRPGEVRSQVERLAAK
jgi:thioredoxin-like negative regulator of GroEL